MTLSTEELQKRISILERKVSREKKARQLAENQLEKYSLDIYEANQSLKNALISSTQKQVELRYLEQTSSDIASEISLNNMLSNIVMLTGKFCSAHYGFFMTYENSKEIPGESNKTWYLEEGYLENNQLKESIKNSLPLAEEIILESWILSKVEINHLKDSSLINSILYTNVALSDNKMVWLCFLSEETHFKEEILPVLNTAREYLISGIRRCLSDSKILKKNKQLQESLNHLEKVRRQLIQSEKMASLGQLAAGVAHEINNPIAFIRSNMEVLVDYLNDYKNLNTEIKSNFSSDNILKASVFEDICEKIDLNYLEEDSNELLQSNIEGLDRVREIVDNLKGFSHSGDEILVEMSLRKCIISAHKIAGNMFKYDHKVDNKVDSACPSILGNTGQLQQVFVNLFVNAAHAMEGKGKLTIDYSICNEGVIIHVTDTGSGMDKETIDQLFTPFFTTKPIGIGTGLGLSVSYAILEAHDAKVTVDSTLNVGTTFHILFPTFN
ncbi:sensor histidine kinase [Pseudocolwellia sp. HL-MZ7]|uniref:sensor histidine kinase n=1 Tax=Pseudocolwellia sp. HL-MZ7 TaxID=3400627 RepID=UPI003CE9EB70